MAYIFNNKITYGDGANLDAFGRLRVSQVTNLLDIKHTYDKNPLLVNELTNGSASSVYNQTNARVRMSTSANNDFVIRESKTNPIYQPGKSQLFEASFNNLVLESNVIKRIGGFVSTTGSPYNSVFDGFFLESNGVTNEISFQIWKSGTTIFSALTTTWDSTQIDVSNIDWTKTQLMLVDYQWLGVGRMRFGMVFSGVPYYFTSHTSIDNKDTVYMSSPNQPVRYEIRQTGAGSGYLDMICSGFSTEGPLAALYQTTSISHTATTTMATSGVKYPYIGMRLKQNFKSVNSNITQVFILNNSNDNYLVTIEFNPSLSTTPSWTDLSNTPFQYSLQNGTPTITASTFVLSSLIGEAGTSALSTLDIDENQIKIGSGPNGTLDEMWVCITPLGANATFNGTINIRYYL